MKSDRASGDSAGATPSRARPPSRRLGSADVRTLVRASGADLDGERLEAVVALFEGVSADLESFKLLDLDSVEPELAFRAAWE
jgi:hypothetical protein